METPTVPSDLVLEVMARLPVKSLMRLRLISKSFFSHTASPNFITSHLALSKSSGYVSLPPRFLNSTRHSIAILDKFFFMVLRPKIPFSFPRRSAHRSESVYVEWIYFFVGSCNGLLCVTDDRIEYLGRVVVLWNPMIGKFKSISDTSLDSNMLRDTRTRITLGFGYDERNDDYKIVRIVISPHKTESSAQAEVYSLKTNSWKRVIFPINYLNNIFLIESYRCPFVHGALHWLVYLRGEANINPVIFLFKLGDEQFKVIKVPQNYKRGESHSDCYVDLMVLKESLALTIFYDDTEDGVERCRVWKMKKYGEVESWTEQILPLTQVSQIYGFTEDGELMFRTIDDEVNIYNLDTRALKESFMLNTKDVIFFRESLVLL